MVKEFDISFDYICFHGPESEAANPTAREREKPKAAHVGPSALEDSSQLGFMSVSVIVTAVGR